MGTSFERRNFRSRVNRGTRCTRLVAAMISSAGSLSESKDLIDRKISRVSGQVWMRANVRPNSGFSKSISMRRNSESFAISQRTIAEILQIFSKAKRSHGMSNHRSMRKAERACQDSASQLRPVVKIFPLILILPLKLPINFALSV